MHRLMNNVDELPDGCLETFLNSAAWILLLSAIVSLFEIIFKKIDVEPLLIFVLPFIIYIVATILIYLIIVGIAALIGLTMDYNVYRKENRQPLYVIDTHHFEGFIHTMLEDGKHSLYSGNKTLRQLRKAENNKHLKAVTAKQLHQWLQKYYQSLCKPFEEITEDQYYDWLGCVPPKRHHNGRFFVGECYTGTLYQFCFRLGDKYYTALRSIRLTDDELNNQINRFAKTIKA